MVYDGYMKSYRGCWCGRKIRNNSCKALTPRASSPNPNNVEQVVTSSSPLLPRQGKYYISDNNHNKCSSPKNYVSDHFFCLVIK